MDQHLAEEFARRFKIAVEHVVESHLSEEPEQALREFLTFARERLKMQAGEGLR